MESSIHRMNVLSLKVVVCYFVLSLLLLLLFPSSSYGDNLRITIVPSSSSDAYVSTANHITSTINNSENKSILIRTIGVNDLYYNKDSYRNTDLFVPIGQHAFKETLKYSDNIPVLASLISQNGFNSIINDVKNYKSVDNIGAIYLDQPIERHLSFSKLVIPGITNFGFIVSNNNKIAIAKLYSLLDKNNHHIEIVEHGGNVINSLSHALDNSDAIIALPDPLVFNLRNTRNILLSSYRKRTPILGFSKAYVKAGALAAIYSSPEDIGRQTGEYIKFISSGTKIKSLPRLHAKYYSISVNNSVARSLGLPVLDANKLESLLQKHVVTSP